MASLRNVTIHWKVLIFHSTVAFCNNSRCHRRDQFSIIFSLFHLYCGQTFFTTRFVINLQEVKIQVLEWMRTIKWDYCYNDCPAEEDASFIFSNYLFSKIKCLRFEFVFELISLFNSNIHSSAPNAIFTRGPSLYTTIDERGYFPSTHSVSFQPIAFLCDTKQSWKWYSTVLAVAVSLLRFNENLISNIRSFLEDC